MATYYPPVGFHFRVDFEGFSSGSSDIRFRDVSGISASLGSREHKEGGENRFSHRLPDRATYGNLVLKRGMLVGSELIGWFKDAIEGFSFDPKDITVSLLNEEHQPLESWSFIRAYPVKWDISAFNAQAGEIVIETIELSYQYFTRVEITSS